MNLSLNGVWKSACSLPGGFNHGGAVSEQPEFCRVGIPGCNLLDGLSHGRALKQVQNSSPNSTKLSCMLNPEKADVYNEYCFDMLNLVRE